MMMTCPVCTVQRPLCVLSCSDVWSCRLMTLTGDDDDLHCLYSAATAMQLVLTVL